VCTARSPRSLSLPRDDTERRHTARPPSPSLRGVSEPCERTTRQSGLLTVRLKERQRVRGVSNTAVARSGATKQSQLPHRRPSLRGVSEPCERTTRQSHTPRLGLAGARPPLSRGDSLTADQLNVPSIQEGSKGCVQRDRRGRYRSLATDRWG